ncbi:MAG TPA: hypothetical protein VHM19_10030 [Polyangiales bacterium]|nr:hypothetical protein [Polyangiales bacterium]
MSGDIATRLRALGAHDDVVSYAARFGSDFRAFAEQCPRGDWLLAIAAKLGADRRALVRAAVSCSREALTYLLEPSPVITGALAAAEAWSRGNGDESSAQAHAKKLQTLPPSADAVEDMVVQAIAAALAAITDPEAAAHAASCTAQAAVLAAGDCAMEVALRFTQEKCAALTRAEISPTQLSTLVA